MGTFSDLKNYVLRVKFWNFEFSSGPFSYWQNVSFFDFVFIKILEWGVFSPPKCSCQSDGHIFGPEKVSFGCQILKNFKKINILTPQNHFFGYFSLVYHYLLYFLMWGKYQIHDLVLIRLFKPCPNPVIPAQDDLKPYRVVILVSIWMCVLLS